MQKKAARFASSPPRTPSTFLALEEGFLQAFGQFVKGIVCGKWGNQPCYVRARGCGSSGPFSFQEGRAGEGGWATAGSVQAVIFQGSNISASDPGLV